MAKKTRMGVHITKHTAVFSSNRDAGEPCNTDAFCLNPYALAIPFMILLPEWLPGVDLFTQLPTARVNQRINRIIFPMLFPKHWREAKMLHFKKWDSTTALG